MLESLEIRGFRTFDHLQIERLGRVNLIVGKNNVGKTALLEALRLYASRGALGLITTILHDHDEVRRETALSQGYSDLYRLGFGEERVRVAFENLFHERGGRHKELPAIRIGPGGEAADTLSIALEWFEEREVEGQPRRTVIPPDKKATREDARLALTSQFGALRKFLLALDETGIRLPAGEPTFRSPGWLPAEELKEVELPVTFISPDGLRSGQGAHLWDSIALTEFEEQVLSALQIIEPTVQRVSAVGDPLHPQARVFVVKLADLDRPMPVRSMGDGMSRVLGIALALVNSQEGMLLVDEIENGLHYSVQPDVWRFIFAVAQRLNVQVFATTHSWDCIDAFQEAAKENEEVDGQLIRIDRQYGTLRAVIADESDLAVITDRKIEVR